MRRIEDRLATLVRVSTELSPLEIWLSQRMMMAGADQQLFNLREAQRRLRREIELLQAERNRAEALARANGQEVSP